MDANRLHDLSPERRARIYRARRIRVLIGAIATGTLLAGTAVAAASTFGGSEQTSPAPARRADDGAQRRMVDAATRKASVDRSERADWEFTKLVDETRRETERRAAEAEAAIEAAEQRRTDKAAAKTKAAEEAQTAAAAEADAAERIAAAKASAKAEKAAELADSSSSAKAQAERTAASSKAAEADRAAAQQAADAKAWMEAAAERERATPTTAAPAPAADAPVGAPWAALAECEASGNWSMNSGNGYYGGLQFNLGTWKSHGGIGMPHENSPAQQIEIAKRVQASQGWGAWPACSRKIGLR